MKPTRIAEVVRDLDVTDAVRLTVAQAFAAALVADGVDVDRHRFVDAATDIIDWQDPTAGDLEGIEL